MMVAKYIGENTLRELVTAAKDRMPDMSVLGQKLRSVSAYLRFKQTGWQAVPNDKQAEYTQALQLAAELRSVNPLKIDELNSVKSDILMSASTGIKYSTDGGLTWQDSNITSGSYATFIKADDGTLIAGSGTWMDSTTHMLVTGGIKYSVNNGETWQDTGITSGSYYAFGKAKNGTLIASNKGIQYSTDNGITWQPTNNKTASCRSFITMSNGTIVAATTANGILYSNDNGESWYSSNVTGYAQSGVFVEADDGTLIFVGGSNVGTNDGIRYSTDSGKTWQLSNITSGSSGMFFKSSTGVILARVSDSFKYSSDNGKTWQDGSSGSGAFENVTELVDGTIVMKLVSSSTPDMVYLPVLF